MEDTSGNLYDAITTPKEIRHIVCSGGGAAGFTFYGVLRNLHKKGIWDLQKIRSMYGTSVGSIMIVALALGYDWDTLDDYLIKRPWHHLFNVSIEDVMEIFNVKGIYKPKVIEEIFSPLFKGKDISIGITMKEFFELTNIDIHIYTVELNSFTIVDISHTTHPDWRIIDAVYCSCSIPLLFAPWVKDDDHYCDGGILVNHPIEFCIKNGADKDEILSIMRYSVTEKKFTAKNTILDYITILINKIHKKILNNDFDDIKHQVKINAEPTTFETIYEVVNNLDRRVGLIDAGVAASEVSMASWASSSLE